MVPVRSSVQAQAGRPYRGASVHMRTRIRTRLDEPSAWAKLARSGVKLQLAMFLGSYADPEGQDYLLAGLRPCSVRQIISIVMILP
jgi:hypothetical protein